MEKNYPRIESASDTYSLLQNTHIPSQLIKKFDKIYRAIKKIHKQYPYIGTRGFTDQELRDLRGLKRKSYIKRLSNYNATLKLKFKLHCINYK